MGGVAEAVLGATSQTGMGAAPGVPAMVGSSLLWVNGWESAYTGLQTALTGEVQHNLASKAAGAAATAMGASPQTVENVMNAGDLASGALSIGGGVAAGTRATGREALEASARQVDEVGKATIEQTARVTRAPLRIRTVNGRVVGQNDSLIDPKLVDARGRTNLERMQNGLAPIGPDGKSVNLHHTTQTEPGPLAELSQTAHQQNTANLHTQGVVSFRNDPALVRSFDAYKRQYWQTRALDFD